MIVCLSLIILLGNIAGGSTDGCLPNYVEDNHKCVPLIEGNCKTDDDCPIANTYCNEVCTCNEGLKPAKDKTFCENKNKRIGDSCKGDECDAIENAICQQVNVTKMSFSPKQEGYTENKCQCKPNHYRWNEGCAKFANNLTDTCEDSIGCRKITGSKCNMTSKTCKCKEKSYYPAEGKCYKKAKGLGGDCKNDAGCTKIDNAGCLSEICKCKKNFYNWEGLCYKYAEDIGDDCKVDENCEKMNNTKCIEKLCNCPTKWYSFGKECFEEVTTIGGECKSWKGCREIDNSNCTNGFCKCQINYYDHENQCFVKAKSLGDNCKNNKGCPDIMGALI
ncbi:GSCOCG00013594001-RA-CDS [Cotesia congregata]|nr:GSCOCG00013594001-RA-CDS [Cotesia congregata]